MRGPAQGCPQLWKALAYAQPASKSTSQQGHAEHLAGSGSMPGMCPQRKDQATPENPAAQVGSGTTEMSQQSAEMEDAHAMAAMAPDLQCHEALGSLGQETGVHRPGKGKSRPPFVHQMLSRQAVTAKRSMRAREQCRPQAGQGATSSTAESSGHAHTAAAAAAAAWRARGKRALGKGKSQTPMTGPSLSKQRAAAEGRQPSQKETQGVTDCATGVTETSSLEAARARLHVWTREQGLGSTVSGPGAIVQTGEAERAPAKEPPAPVEEAARQSKRQIREPFAQAILDIPKQLASRAKQGIKVNFHLIICCTACPVCQSWHCLKVRDSKDV